LRTYVKINRLPMAALARKARVPRTPFLVGVGPGAWRFARRDINP
jgi:hypothetical protein